VKAAFRANAGDEAFFSGSMQYRQAHFDRTDARAAGSSEW
jgi:hypothetical protein